MVQWIRVAVQNSKFYVLIYLALCSLDPDTVLAKSLHILFLKKSKELLRHITGKSIELLESFQLGITQRWWNPDSPVLKIAQDPDKILS
jgi:hypothetical protein